MAYVSSHAPTKRHYWEQILRKGRIALRQQQMQPHNSGGSKVVKITKLLQLHKYIVIFRQKKCKNIHRFGLGLLISHKTM